MSRATNILWSVREHLASINEDSIVKFQNQLNPENGWAVIMSGGSGSGKGYILQNKVAITGKTFDVDHLKELYAKKHNLDLSDPEVTSMLHQYIKDKGWKEATQRNYFKDKAGKNPNIIFDITGDSLKKVSNIAIPSKDMGYNVSLIWVVTSRERAIIQNALRSRTVPDEVLHNIHSSVNSAMLSLLLEKSVQSEFINLIDEMWVVINSEESGKRLLNRTNPKDKDTYIPFSSRDSATAYRIANKDNIIQVKEIGKPFEAPTKTLEDIKRIIGSHNSNDYVSTQYVKDNNLVSAAERGEYRLNKNLNQS